MTHAQSPETRNQVILAATEGLEVSRGLKGLLRFPMGSQNFPKTQ